MPETYRILDTLRKDSVQRRPYRVRMANEAREASKEEVADRLHEIWGDLKNADGEVSQAAFARRIGADPQKLNNWMQALNLISIDGAFAIERVLRYRVHWVVYGDLPKKLPPDRVQRLTEALERIPAEKLHLIEEMAEVLANKSQEGFFVESRHRDVAGRG